MKKIIIVCGFLICSLAFSQTSTPISSHIYECDGPFRAVRSDVMFLNGILKDALADLENQCETISNAQGKLSYYHRIKKLNVFPGQLICIDVELLAHCDL